MSVALRVPEGAIPESVVELCRKIRAGGYRAWVVGGSLRDVLMGREPKDWDLATSATPSQMQGLFRRVIPTGIEHGTVTVVTGGATYEVTTLRGEGAYSDSRRPDAVFFITDIEQDLARRDFTVNALAYDPLEDRLIDPFGGIADAQRRVLRTVGSAKERFDEDGLRILRAARFVATLELAIDPETKAAIGEALPKFARVSAERVHDEWLRMMQARVPSRGLELMRETGILGVTCPELLAQVGCAQNRYHAYDVWMHSLLCMDACEGGPVHRIAGLLHDLGKPATRALSDKTGDYTFYEHERVGAEMAERFLLRMRFSNEDRAQIVHLVRHHLVCYDPSWSDAAVRRFVKRVGLEHLGALLGLARADALAKGRDVQAELTALAELEQRANDLLTAGAALSTRDLAIDGNEVMRHLGIAPSRAVGQVLEQLLSRVLDDPAQNEREALLRATEEIARELGLSR